ncbi:hypothetical protein [Actinokineospora cianjurensis]|uniref:Uncharacterized protein n=1 Tax=Actinokineospora cianjurensis TaxID=585224 RepID=A0A421B115_9PSEU|nr:hypothetical protein [Actinokineospora cianjurensis]RLK57971.1 hypothetical protein CLV68_4062 [Actinokineospora cianjurensis]
MTENEMSTLRDVADQSILFHNGLWGGPMGFRWSDTDGGAAGTVPQWQSESLEVLIRRGLAQIEPATGGGRLAKVSLTPTGTDYVALPMAA